MKKCTVENQKKIRNEVIMQLQDWEKQELKKHGKVNFNLDL